MPLGCCCTGVTRLNTGSCCMFSAASLKLVGGDLPDERPADTPTPRGEGAGLSAPAAAAKEEQLAQHRDPRYQPPTQGWGRGRYSVGPGAIFSGAVGGVGVGCEDAHRAGRPGRYAEGARVPPGIPG